MLSKSADDVDEFAEVISDIDWDTISASGLAEALDAAGIETKYQVSEL